jgi:hypothetical protein
MLYRVSTDWIQSHVPPRLEEEPYKIYDMGYDGLPVVNHVVTREATLLGGRCRTVAPQATGALAVGGCVEVRMTEPCWRVARWGVYQHGGLVEFTLDGPRRDGVEYAYYSVGRASNGYWEGQCGVYSENCEGRQAFEDIKASFALQDALGLTTLTDTDCGALTRLMRGWANWSWAVSPGRRPKARW